MTRKLFTHEHRLNYKKMLIVCVGLSLLTHPFIVYAHSGGINQSALAVCREKQKSQVCQYQGHHNDLYVGTCQYVSEEDLICVRNKPIQVIKSKEKENSFFDESKED